ncbi:MAG: hypothetical protein IKZ19_09755 [Clostridia bacterium]|nr:hypothetical protein [Clostridia bacterium]
MRVILFGGDRRTLLLSRLFLNDGHKTDIWGGDKMGVPSVELREAESAELLVLPYPCLDGDFIKAPFADVPLRVSELFEMKPSALVFAGAPGEVFFDLAKKNGISARDYVTERLLDDNAYLTAEGALGLAIENMPCRVRGSEILILGCGRIGRYLAELFGALGARVTVSALREESLRWIGGKGFSPVRTDRLAGDLGKFALIANTVPRQIFKEAEIFETDKECILLELASHPGGFELTAAEKIGRRIIGGGGLPGKTSPKTAAEIVYREIKDILETEEI